MLRRCRGEQLNNPIDNGRVNTQEVHQRKGVRNPAADNLDSAGFDTQLINGGYRAAQFLADGCAHRHHRWLYAHRTVAGVSEVG